MPISKEGDNSVVHDYIVWFLFIAVGFSGLLNHEVWLDEAHHWLVVRDVENFSEFLKVESVDGQPFIWPVMIYILQLFSDDIFSFQLFHFTIGATSALLFLRCSPFKKVDKYLFVFSYTMIYEYLVISRNYSLSVLILFIYLGFFRQKSVLTKTIVLGILANTHFFAAVIATSLFMYEVGWRKKDLKLFIKEHALNCLIFVGFLLLLSLQLWNSQDHAVMTQYNDWTFFERLKRLVVLHFKSFIMLPDFSSIHFWNQVWLFKLSKAFGIMAIPAFLFPLCLLKDKKTLIAYYTTILIISIFLFSIHQPIASRYASFIFVCFLVFYWLQREIDLSNEKESTGRYHFVLLVLLIIQVFSGVTSNLYDFKYSFSEGKNVAEYIKKTNDKDRPLIIHPYSASPAVSVYTGEQYYSLVTQSMASFCRWETNPFQISRRVFFERLTKYIQQNGDGVDILIHNSSEGYGNFKNDVFQLERVHTFEPAIVRNEEYTLYKVILMTDK